MDAEEIRISAFGTNTALQAGADRAAAIAVAAIVDVDYPTVSQQFVQPLMMNLLETHI